MVDRAADGLVLFRHGGAQHLPADHAASVAEHGNGKARPPEATPFAPSASTGTAADRPAAHKLGPPDAPPARPEVRRGCGL